MSAPYCNGESVVFPWSDHCLHLSGTKKTQVNYSWVFALYALVLRMKIVKPIHLTSSLLQGIVLTTFIV